MMTIVTRVTLREGAEPEWDAAMRERLMAAQDQPGWIGGQILIPLDGLNRRVIVDEAFDRATALAQQLIAAQDGILKEVADALRVDPSTATRAVQRLVKAGLAQRRPGQEDGRVVQVELTDAGKAVYQKVFERRVVLMTDILSHYTVEELPVLTDMLERFVRAVDEFVESRPTDS